MLPLETVADGGAGRVYGGLSAAERDARTREALLAAGRELFADNGFAATGGRDLCRPAEGSERAFYATVCGREALLRSAYLAATDEVIADIERGMADAAQDPIVRLEAGLAAFFASISDDPRLGRLIYVESLGRGPEIESARREGLDRFTDLVLAQLAPFAPKEPLPPSAVRAGVAAALTAVGELAYRAAEGAGVIDGPEGVAAVAAALAGAAVGSGLIVPPPTRH